MSAKIPRADSKLKRLSEEIQQSIFEMCGKPGLTQRAILDWIEKECDVQSSARGLSEFLSWYAARLEARKDEERVNVFLAEERQLHPEMSKDDLFERGQRMFSLLAMSRQDPKAWTTVQKVEIERADSITNRQKFKRETGELILKALADERCKEIGASGATHEEKLRALDQTLFPEDWAK
jgi:hypothetical protein